MKRVLKTIVLATACGGLVTQGQAGAPYPQGGETSPYKPTPVSQVTRPVAHLPIPAPQGARPPMPVLAQVPAPRAAPPSYLIDDLHATTAPANDQRGPMLAELPSSPVKDLQLPSEQIALPSGAPSSPASASLPAAVPALASPPAAVKVNNKHIVFNYDVKDVGPSGVSAVEVWSTRDSKTWQKCNRMTQEGPCSVDVEAEGTYGFTFVARNGFGGGSLPPQEGDPPQVWVEVDVTPPSVVLTRCVPDFANHTLLIEWTATDKNLARKPITLSYSERTSGPWAPFATNLENTGRHLWQLSPATPSTLWLRVDAADTASNLGTALSQSAVRIDLSRPKVTNIRVGTAATQE